MNKIIGAGVAAGIGVIGLTLVVPQAAYSAAPAHDRGNKYTLAQVATHATAADCWSAVNFKVYNLTTWLQRYPTQPIPVASLCGKDASAAFNALTVVHNDDDEDGDDDSTSSRSHRDRGGDDDGDDDSRGSSGRHSASPVATTLPAPSASGSASLEAHHGDHGDNPWLRSIKRYRIGKLVSVATGSATASSTASASASVTATATPTPSATTFTLAQVKQHATVADCWTAISGKVYNMSGYSQSHPGGPTAIAGLCGTDGTTSFTGKHGSAPNPAAVLASRLIGTLV